MNLQDKYNEVITFSESLGADNISVVEEPGVLKVRATVQYPYYKNIIWDKIKYIGGQSPSDLIADIQVSDPSCYTKHTVEAGETLGKIAKQYFDDSAKYKEIYAANTDILDNPDLIQIGQVLVIPNI
ncbi:MAG: LysM peptidoglycan-binding domain-containing protein [Saprospiraceae bacterium]|jgi:nucleoid-associated protein YgaU|nr:LysM peptidoglycan-binding domain-containing protein [Saprospiraceae bacterium]MBL0293986.1 LysM peptidoglycan-binding domain-containing protein [Saprospiraceae bacterium]